MTSNYESENYNGFFLFFNIDMFLRDAIIEVFVCFNIKCLKSQTCPLSTWKMTQKSFSWFCFVLNAQFIIIRTRFIRTKVLKRSIIWSFSIKYHVIQWNNGIFNQWRLFWFEIFLDFHCKRPNIIWQNFSFR